MKDSNLEIKILKNKIYDETSSIFIHNLKKLIQLEGTQKKLASKIGVSEDLLSKYKSGDAFPAIETILYICKLYNITIDEFLNIPLTSSYFEDMLYDDTGFEDIFKQDYFCYFFVTNSGKKSGIHESNLRIAKKNCIFRIYIKGEVIKEFKGTYKISDNLVFFNLYSREYGYAYITMIKPSLNKSKYIGGIAMLSLPSDANSKPCCQKIIISSSKINRELSFDILNNFLCFKSEKSSFGNIKISRYEDEKVYDFITNLNEETKL
ncbi:DNA-binding protein [Clostridium acetobutylicum]|nr:DNA-binding protein [Clostridium acetobutylicum]